MRRFTRACILVSMAMALLAGPGITVGADPPREPHPDSNPEGGERVGPVHPISGGVGIQAAPTGTVDFVSGGWWLDSGDLIVAGEVFNGMSTRRAETTPAGTPGGLNGVQIDVTIKDAGGDVVGTISCHVGLDWLAPGMTAGFWCSVPAPPGADSVWIEVQPGSAVTALPQGALRVTLGRPYQTAINVVRYPVTLANLAPFAVQMPWVYLTLYDASGSVIPTTFGLHDLPSLIPAGGSITFEAWDFRARHDVARVAVAADARRSTDFWTYVTSWNNYFNDIGFSAFRPDILWNAETGVTTGCAPALYCPEGFVTREQMASFLARSLHLSGAAPNAFTDDDTSQHHININLVAREKIATGCGGGKFCPTGLVSREQMASFLARALKLSGAAPNAFTDDDTSQHHININLVAREGVATGCGGGRYCPTQNVTRGQMAAFLHRAFGP